MKGVSAVAFCLACALGFAGCSSKTGNAESPVAHSSFEALFAKNCSGCHGANGEGGPVFSLNYPLYLAWAGPVNISQTIENGRAGTPMPAFAKARGGPLDDSEINILVQGMQVHWAHRVLAFSRSASMAYLSFRDPPGLLPTDAPPYSAPNGDPQNGAALFITSCAPCHGDGGRRKGFVGPVNVSSYVSLASDQGLRTAIVVGRPTLGMPDWRHRGRILTSEEISDIVASLASQRAQPAVASATITPQETHP